MAKYFLDTNVIVYANDARDPGKQARALEIVTGAIARREGVVSTQVLQEYVVAAQKKLHQEPDVIAAQLVLLETLEVVQFTPALIRRALELQSRYLINYWDAAILAAAEHARCRLLWSEDLDSGRLYGTVRVQNPFAG